MIAEIITIFLFYLFALLQSSFFVHFNFFGSVLNLVFIFLFLIVFFSPKKIDYTIIIYAIIAGLFLDIFSYAYLGLSAVLLVIIAYLSKKIQASLKEKQDKYPFVYFLPLFLAWFLIYELLLMIYFRFADPSHALIIFNFGFLLGIIYNLLAASLGFYIFKKAKFYIKKDK